MSEGIPVRSLETVLIDNIKVPRWLISMVEREQEKATIKALEPPSFLKQILNRPNNPL